MVNDKEVPFGTIDKLRYKNIPVFPGLFAAIGAGMVWASIGQGSGELIWWPYLTAKYHGHFLGWLLLACFWGYWVNQEVIRYTATTGENIFTGFTRVSRVFAGFMWLMLLVTFLWFGGYASAGGTALATLTGFPVGWSERAQSLFWGYSSIFIYLIPIVFGRVVYKWIEGILKFVAIVSVVSLLIAVFHPTVFAKLGGFLESLLSPKLSYPSNWDPKDTNQLITAITFTGMGGFFTLMYSYWVRDKLVGMAGHMGRVTSPITGKLETITATGYVFEDTDENKRNYGKWIRALHVDNFIGVGINTVTLLILVMLAWALLMPTGDVPSGWKIAVVQSRFFEVAWGPFGKALFLIIAAVFLSDTWLGVTDAVSRMHSDYIYANFKKARKRTFRWWYYLWVAILTVITCTTMLFATPGSLIIMGGLFNFIAMVIYCPVLIYMNYYKIPRIFPKWTRPGKISLAMICFSTIAYVYLTILYIRTLL